MRCYFFSNLHLEYDNLIWDWFVSLSLIAINPITYHSNVVEGFKGINSNKLLHNWIIIIKDPSTFSLIGSDTTWAMRQWTTWWHRTLVNIWHTSIVYLPSFIYNWTNILQYRKKLRCCRPPSNKSMLKVLNLILMCGKTILNTALVIYCQCICKTVKLACNSSTICLFPFSWAVTILVFLKQFTRSERQIEDMT